MPQVLLSPPGWFPLPVTLPTRIEKNRVSLIIGLLITELDWTGLDWNLKICFYALWYAVTTNNYLDLLELP